MKVTLEDKDRGIGNLDLDALRLEINEYYEAMRSFENLDPIDILSRLSAFTSRASQVRFNLIKAESKQIQNFRTKELDPFIGECDRQFKVWSRLLSAYQLEWETSKGQA